MITEQDIFNFVFFPQVVDEDKKRYISQRSELRSLVDFYRSIKDESDKPISEKVKQDLSLKINGYSYRFFFRLKKVENVPTQKNSEMVVLAAATDEDEPEVIAKSFIDENNQFLIRVIKTKGITKIYSFSSDNQEIHNFKLKVLPSGRDFLVDNNSKPLELKEELDFEEIQLELIK